jgi:bifunctional UDP-N-acetylglucosamine pyrophosphorylase/glucosamine-1-phosphate N-acetyltransferase
LILYGDTPLVRTEDLQLLLKSLDTENADLAVMSCELDQPTGYGRILRSAEGRVLEVREERDLRTSEERGVREVNAGMYAAKLQPLLRALGEIRPNNAQGEYYLTDAVALIGRTGRVVAVKGHPEALLGVNDRDQLHHAEELMLTRIRSHHARNGVTVRGNARIEVGIEIGVDAVIENNVHLRGRTRVETSAYIDIGSIITDSAIGEGARIKPYSVITQSEVGARAEIGPFAHLRPESQIDELAHIGNFVETKKTRVRKGAKANHLAYLGDGDIGERANIGAGTIFCNYDGFKKHRTVIGEGAFIGSDSQLVAPVTVGKGAYVGTGTTVTEDVPDNALAIGRVRQENKPEYAARLKERLACPPVPDKK